MSFGQNENYHIGETDEENLNNGSNIDDIVAKKLTI